MADKKTGKGGKGGKGGMSHVLIELSLPSADTVIHNSRVLFHNQYIYV